MSLKKVILLFHCILFFTYSFSQIPIVQEFELTDGEPYDTKKEELTKFEELLYKDFFFYKGKAISIKVGETKRIYYQLYDLDKLTSTKTKTIYKREEGLNKYSYEGTIQKEDTVYQFLTLREAREGKDGHKVFLQKICISTGEVSDLMLLFKDDFIPGRRGRRINITRFGEDRFLINYKLNNIVTRDPDHPLRPIGDEAEEEVLCFVVCDANMNILWRKKVIMPILIKGVKVMDLMYDEISEELVMFVHFPGNDQHFEVWKYDEFNENKKVIKLSCDKCNNFIHSVKLKQGNDGHFFLAGFTGELSLTNGFYISEFDSNGKNVKEFVNEIPFKTINDYNESKTQKKNVKKVKKGKPVGIPGLSLTDFTINVDGTVLIHGEAYNGNSSVNYGSIAMGGIPMAKAEHFYLSMFAAKIDASGKVIWMNKMPKNQLRETGGPGAFNVLFAAPKAMDLSYNYLNSTNYHYFVFMDHEDNYNVSVNRLPVEHASGRRGVLWAYRINDSTGELNKAHLFNSRDLKGMMLTGYLTNNLTLIDDNEFFIEMHKKKKEDLLLKIELKD